MAEPCNPDGRVSGFAAGWRVWAMALSLLGLVALLSGSLQEGPSSARVVATAATTSVPAEPTEQTVCLRAQAEREFEDAGEEFEQDELLAAVARVGKRLCHHPAGRRLRIDWRSNRPLGTSRSTQQPRAPPRG